MDLDKAIARLKFTHYEKNKPDDQDRIALNKVMIELNYLKAQANEANNNTLLKKAIIQLFLNDLVRTDGNYSIALFNLKLTLKCSLSDLVKEFHSESNLIGFNAFCKNIGMNEQNQDQLIQDNAEKLAEALTHFSLEAITERLKEMCEDFIIKYNDNL